MDTRRKNRRISVEEAAKLFADEESDGDDLDELVTLEELQDDDGYCNVVVSDDETVTGNQSPSGQSCKGRLWTLLHLSVRGELTDQS